MPVTNISQESPGLVGSVGGPGNRGSVLIVTYSFGQVAEFSLSSCLSSEELDKSMYIFRYTSSAALSK